MSFICMFIASFFENYIFKELNRLENRNFHSGVMFTISSIVLFASYLVFFGYDEKDFLFFYEWKFYLLSILEIIVFYLYRENYNKNKENFTMINMFVFSTIYLMPILTFIYNPLFDFNTMHDIKYDSIFEAAIFSFILFILTMVYYIDKIKNKMVKNLKLLILLLFFLLNTMYFSIKTIQTYNGLLVYSFIQAAIALYFLSQSKNEPKKIYFNKLYILSIWPFVYILVIIAANLIAVEFISIFKRVSQIIAAMILDKKFMVKDSLIIALIIGVSIVFYIYKV